MDCIILNSFSQTLSFRKKNKISIFVLESFDYNKELRIVPCVFGKDAIIII